MSEVCPLCGGKAARDFLRAGPHQLVRCVGCGLVRVNHAVAEATSYDGDEYFVEKNRYLEQWDQFCCIFDALLEKIGRYKSGGRLLDVGCGVGCLVSRAVARGYASQGVEFSGWASAFAREEKGLDVRTGTLAQAEYQSESFDVVVINHVLEHVPDPAAVLREARRVLKKEGLLVVGVPNVGSIMARLAGAQWASLRPEEHRWHFAPITLKALLRKEGFLLLDFEAKENHVVAGWHVKSLLRRVINCAAVLCNRGEAMLAFAQPQVHPHVELQEGERLVR